MLINKNESQGEFSIRGVDNDIAYKEYVDFDKGGIFFIPEPYGNTALGMKADGPDFAKWLKQNQSSIAISLPPSTPKISLHGADIWLPLMYLASDVTMPVFLNLVSSYVYEKIKGNLTQDRTKVHFSAIYESIPDGITKKFEFSGDGDALSKISKQFNLENFYDDCHEQ